jgi:hypothetical protein
MKIMKSLGILKELEGRQIAECGIRGVHLHAILKYGVMEVCLC